jgi:hypothetical protein
VLLQLHFDVFTSFQRQHYKRIVRIVLEVVAINQEKPPHPLKLLLVRATEKA